MKKPKLTPDQQRTLVEFNALHKLQRSAFEDRDCPPEAVAVIWEFIQDKIAKLKKKDFEAVARSFVD